MDYQNYMQFDPETHSNPAEVVIKCIESGTESILLDESSVSTEFFDLSSGLLGELLHKMSIYRMKLAIVVSEPGKYSQSFQSFLCEANRGNSIRSFSSRQEAINWLKEI